MGNYILKFIFTMRRTVLSNLLLTRNAIHRGMGGFPRPRWSIDWWCGLPDFGRNVIIDHLSRWGVCRGWAIRGAGVEGGSWGGSTRGRDDGGGVSRSRDTPLHASHLDTETPGPRLTCRHCYPSPPASSSGSIVQSAWRHDRQAAASPSVQL